MASTKEMQARARARRQAKNFVNQAAQNAAKQQGLLGINMHGSSSFTNSATRIMTATPNASAERFNALARLFIAEAQKHGGEQAAKEMETILNEQRTILLEAA